MNGTQDTTAIHPAVQEELDRIDKERQKALSLNADAWSLSAAVEGLTVGRGEPKVNVYTGINSWNKAGVACWEVSDLTKLTPLFRALRKAGWRAGKPEDEPDLRRRSYELTLVADPNRAARLLIFTPFLADNEGEGATCKWVQTGVEEKPVYKLMCGDTEAPAPEEVEHVA